MSEKDVVPRRLIASSKSPIVLLTALKAVGKSDFSLIDENFLKSKFLTSSWGGLRKGSLQSVCRFVVLTSCSRLATL
jgi:hypothetical protein